MEKQKILDAFTEEEIFDLTAELVSIPSYTGLKNQEEAVAARIFDFFQKEDIEVFYQYPLDNRPNVIARIRGSAEGRSLMLSGHMDTVPPYNMTGDPYSGSIMMGNLYGRGSCDMKGALACMMGTMAAIKRSEVILEGDLVFAAVINEEQKSEGTEYIVKHGPYTDAAIIGEPTGLNIAAGHRGLEWIQIEVIGKTTHGGTPDEGVNAISKAAKLITRIENELVPKFRERRHPLIGEPLLNFGVIEGGDQPSSVAGYCNLYIDRRWTPLETFDMVMEDFKQIIDQMHCEDDSFRAVVKRYFDNGEMMLHKPLETDLNDPLINSLRKGVRSSLDREAEIVSFLAWTDASLLSNFAGITSAVFGPGYLKKAHSEDEYVELEQLTGAYRTYTLAALDYCGGK